MLQAQRAFFDSGKTLPVAFRRQMLKKLQKAINEAEPQILAALQQDLGKSDYESFLCEVGLVRSELSYMLRHLKGFAKPRRVHTPMAHFLSGSTVLPSPYGCVLIMSPWNYPFMLTLEPLIDALAAGNTAVVKPSAYSPATAQVVRQLLEGCFPPDYVAVVTGGREENARLLEEPFDMIFFTGSQAVGRQVLRKAADRLIPAVLELGGKSPCIVDRTADLQMAARRIVFGKFLNCGQTCVAPDYVLCHSAVKEQLLSLLQQQLQAQYGPEPLQNPDYGRIVNEKHFRRLLGLLDSGRIVTGGQAEPQQLRLAPTVLTDVSWDSPVMQEEIFGPVLPVLTYEDEQRLLARLQQLPQPLALYLFSRDKATIRQFTRHCRFGGGCVNDCVVHLATPHMGFGGVGQSGMGAYHGKAGFDAFSHRKSILRKATWLDLPMRYQPYRRKRFSRLLRLFLR